MQRRITKFKPEYCDLLLEHMGRGLSFASFAARVGVVKQTLYNWLAVSPEFEEAKDIGEAKSLLFWENLGLAAALGKVPHFNARAYRLQFWNRFGKFRYYDQN